MFIAALVQKKMKVIEKNKGHTIFICDDNKQQMSNFSDALYQADPWFDPIYQSRKTKKGKTSADGRFDQIINTGFAIKSEHSSLVQVADAVSYAYRRHLELKSQNERWPVFCFACGKVRRSKETKETEKGTAWPDPRRPMH